MAFTVSDFQDLLAVLRQNPEWLAQLRELIVADDFRKIEAALDRMREELHATRVAFDERMRAFDERPAAFDERLAAFDERLAAFDGRLASLDDRLSTLAEAQTRTEQHLARLDDKTGKLTGFMVEERLRRNAPGYFGRRLNRAKVVLPSELALLREADRQGKISDDDWLQVNQLDIVVRGFEPNGADRGDEVVYAVEASAMVDRHDVERASACAEILARAGYDARPVVGGVTILENARELAERMKVAVVLNPNLEN